MYACMRGNTCTHTFYYCLCFSSFMFEGTTDGNVKPSCRHLHCGGLFSSCHKRTPHTQYPPPLHPQTNPLSSSSHELHTWSLCRNDWISVYMLKKRTCCLAKTPASVCDKLRLYHWIFFIVQLAWEVLCVGFVHFTFPFPNGGAAVQHHLPFWCSSFLPRSKTSHTWLPGKHQLALVCVQVQKLCVCLSVWPLC